MKNQDKHLHFLRDTINRVGYARFRAETSYDLELPHNIIRTFKTDDEGNIWFFTSCRSTYAKDYNQPFYARLEYIENGGLTRLSVGGRAEIVKGSEMDAPQKGTMVMIKLKMINVEFYQKEQNKPLQPVYSKMKGFFAQLVTPRSRMREYQMG